MERVSTRPCNPYNRMQKPKTFFSRSESVMPEDEGSRPINWFYTDKYTDAFPQTPVLDEQSIDPDEERCITMLETFNAVRPLTLSFNDESTQACPPTPLADEVPIYTNFNEVPIYANFDENSQAFFPTPLNVDQPCLASFGVNSPIGMQAFMPHDMPTPTLPVSQAVGNPEAMSTPVEKMNPELPCPERKKIIRVKARVEPGANVTRDIARFELGNGRCVVVCLFKGETKVHIREYSGTNRPTLKGICLTPSRWATLVSRMSILDDELARPAGQNESGEPIIEEGEHLGGYVYAKASNEYRTVDVRQYFVPKGARKQIPTRKGIMLRHFEWASLRRLAREITESAPDLMNVIPCSMSLDHSNMAGFLACLECNPSGDTVY